MKKILAPIIAITFLFGMASPSLASDISEALYYGTIRASNNSTAAEYVSGNLSLNSSSLITAGMLNASANNCAVRNSTGADTAFMPGYDDNPWAVWFEDIPANSSEDATLYTNSTGGKIRYFAGEEGMTTSNSATLEPSDNFTNVISGFFDTSQTDAQIFTKPGAISCNVTASEEITATIFSSSTTNTTANIVPNAAGLYTNIEVVFGAATHWEAVDDTPGASDNDTSYIRNTAGTTTQKIDAYNVASPIFAGEVVNINSIAVVYNHYEVGGTVKVQPFLFLGSANTTGTEIDAGAVWAITSETLTRPGGGNWTLNDLADLQVGIGLRETTGGSTGRVSSVYVQINYEYSTPACNVTATNISSSEHILSITADGYFLGIGTDNTTGNFPISDNLSLNLPFHHDDLLGTSLTSKDNDEHTATVTGATWGTYGRTFDGNDDDIDCGQPAAWNFGTSDVSFVIWLKNTGGDGTAESILSKCEADFDGFYMYINTNGQVAMRLRDTGAGGAEPNMGVDIGADNTWHQIVWSLDRDGNMLGYLDNELKSTTDISGIGSITAVANLLIGEGNIVAERNNFNGPIGEVQIYLKVLSHTEIDKLYNDTKWRYDGTWGENSSGYLIYNILNGNTVPDNSNDWVDFQNDSAPYVEYIKRYVGGNLVQHIEWEYSETFTDLSGNGNDATPTFRENSSDPDVTTTLISFAPLELSRISEADSSEWGTMMEDPPDMPSTTYTEESRPGIFFEPLVHSIWSLSGLPDSFFWYNFAFLIIIGLGMITFYFFARNNTQALLIKVITMAAIIAFFALPGPNIYGFYVLIYFAFWCFGILVLSRSYGW